MEFILLIFVFVFVIGPLAKAYADRLSRQLPPGSETTHVEVARLREEVERLAAQVDQLSDEQSFLLRLLNPGDEPAAHTGLPPAEQPLQHPDPQPGEP